MASRQVWRLAVAAAALVPLVFAAATAGPASAGRAPVLAWTSSSNSFDYGTVQVGQTKSLTFTLTNSGGSATAALKVSLSTPGAFSITSDGCTGSSLGPRKSCTVTVQYAPTTAGQRDSADLTATSKKLPTGVSTTLTGTGASVAGSSEAQFYCGEYGGTYGGSNVELGGYVLWSCTGYRASDTADNTLDSVCHDDGGTLGYWSSDGEISTYVCDTP